MNVMDSFLRELYDDDEAPEVVTTAESMMIDKIASSEESSVDQQLDELPVEVLAQMVISTQSPSSDEDGGSEKLASDDQFGAQVMAHAMFHEFKMIKHAMAQGLCRRCKEAPAIGGTSLCGGC